MFYDALMEKQAAEKNKKRKKNDLAMRVLGAGAGAGAAVVGSKGGPALQRRSGRIMRAGIKDDPAALRQMLKDKMGATGVGNSLVLTGKRGRKFNVTLDSYHPEVAGNAAFDVTPRAFGTNKNIRGNIYHGVGMNDRDIFFHEFGHATGMGAKGRVAKMRMGMQAPGRLLGKYNKTLGLGGAAYAGSASNKRQADTANSLANALLLSNAVAELPTLAEEARASIRANALAKKFTGKGVNKRNLAAAYGTYLGSALTRSAPALLAKGIAKYKQHKYRDEKTAQREEAGDHLLGGSRMFSGAMLGGGLGAGAAFNLMSRDSVATDMNKMPAYFGSPARQAGLLGGLAAGAGLGGLAAFKYHRAQQRKRGLGPKSRNLS